MWCNSYWMSWCSGTHECKLSRTLGVSIDLDAQVSYNIDFSFLWHLQFDQQICHCIDRHGKTCRDLSSQAPLSYCTLIQCCRIMGFLETIFIAIEVPINIGNAVVVIGVVELLHLVSMRAVSLFLSSMQLNCCVYSRSMANLALFLLFFVIVEFPPRVELQNCLWRDRNGLILAELDPSRVDVDAIIRSLSLHALDGLSICATSAFAWLQRWFPTRLGWWVHNWWLSGWMAWSIAARSFKVVFDAAGW